jgi:hypothetical protein
MTIRRLLSAVLLTALVVIGAPVASASAATQQGLSWASIGLPGTTPTTGGTPLNVIACPVSGTCLTGSATGDIYFGASITSTSSPWIKVVAGIGTAIVGLACPTTTLCVALRSDGSVLTSTNPTSAASSWATSQAEVGQTEVALSCISANACFAVDASGNFLSTTSPTSGAWAASALPSGSVPTVLNCTSDPMCLVGTNGGQVLVSSGPSAISPTWSRSVLGSGDWISSIYCTSVSFCAVGTAQSQVVTSTNPTSATPAWTTQVDPVTAGIEPVIVTCASPSLCVAVAEDHTALFSTNPTAGSASWTSVLYGIGSYSVPMNALVCTTTTFCAGVDGQGNVDFTRNPTGAQNYFWLVDPVDLTTSITSTVCNADVSCLATDAGGDVLTTLSTTRLAAWTTKKLGAGQLVSSACSGQALCVVGDAAGSIHWSTTAFAAAPTWTAVALGGGVSITAISCPTTTYCAAIDANNNFWVTGTPTGAASGWTEVALPDTQGLSALSCPATGTCAVSDFAGGVVRSTSPATASSWVATQVAPVGGITALSCGSATTCIAGASNGAVYSSSTAFGAGPSWSAQTALPSSVSGISCTTATVCTAMSQAPVSTADGGSTWTAATGTPPTVGYSVSCANAGTCVIGGEGSLSIGVAGGTPQLTQGLPATTTYDATGPVTLSVIANGTPAPTLTWQGSTDGTTFTTIPGATGPSITLSQATAATLKSVQVTATNGFGSATSSTTLSRQFFVPVTTLPSAIPGTAYQPVTLTAANIGVSTSPYITTVKWKRVTFPKGMTLSTTGVLGGTPSKHYIAPASITVSATETVVTFNGTRNVVTKTVVTATFPFG